MRYLTCMLIHMLFVYTASFVKTVLLKIHMIRRKLRCFFFPQIRWSRIGHTFRS
ncbi:hypothetical protein AB205_0191910 [Aquarana catesbeiana]|uniref:Uncharacterized protein n=1 Tax=Aquarana catesbeiana TaxID=8400 RepID=A0A2G9QCB4_AQUCT|nr:hypothetical protein AB205_0191910 [Aquarana catesbeiana]